MQSNQKNPEKGKLLLDKKTIMQFSKQQQHNTGIDDKTSGYSTCPTMALDTLIVFDTL